MRAPRRACPGPRRGGAGRRGSGNGQPGAREPRARTPAPPSRRRTTARVRRTRARAAQRGRRRRLRRRRSHGRENHGRRRPLGRHAPERRQHPGCIGALRLVRDEQQVGSLEGGRARAAGTPRSADLPARAGRAPRGPARSSRGRERSPPAGDGRAPPPRRRAPAGRRPRRARGPVRAGASRPVGIAALTACGERHIDVVAAQLAGELRVAQRRSGDLERSGFSGRRRDDQHLRHRPEFRPGRWSPSAARRCRAVRTALTAARLRPRVGIDDAIGGALTLVALVLLTMIGVHDSRRPVYGPIDEVTHTAYVLAVAKDGIPPFLGRDRAFVASARWRSAMCAFRRPTRRAAPPSRSARSTRCGSRRPSSRPSTTTPPRR